MPYFIKLVLLSTAMVFPLAVFVWWRGWKAFGSLRAKKAYTMKMVYSWFLMSFLVYPVYLMIWHYGDMGLSYNTQSTFLALYFWYGFVLMTQLFWVLITFSIAFFIFKMVSRDSYQKVKKNIPFYSSVLILVMIIFVGTKAYSDFNSIVIEEPVLVDVEGLEEDEEIKIVHISDLQADAFTGQTKMLRYVEAVNELKPDLVIFTGDLITEGQSFIPVGAEMLGKIDSRYGVYAVYGDHDIWYGTRYVKEEYEKQGISVLENENSHLVFGEVVLRLTGVNEAYSVKIPEPKLNELLNDTTDAMIRISMSHQPSERIVKASADAGYDLYLGGHTHGGQIVIPFFFVTINPALMETPYPVGKFEVEGLIANINSGLGASLSPLRYGAPASVSTIILR